LQGKNKAKSKKTENFFLFFSPKIQKTRQFLNFALHPQGFFKAQARHPFVLLSKQSQGLRMKQNT